MRGSPVLAALVAASALLLATGVEAQDTCDLLQSRSSTVRMTRDAIFNYISQPVFGCDGGAIIRADSAELNDVSNSTRFIGNFEYRDSTAFMIADRADHFASAGRLIGVGNVHITDEATGAVFQGDSAVLVGSSSRREGGELTIVGHDGRRAHAVILVSPRAVAPDSSEAPPDSAAVAGDSAAAADSTLVPPDSARVAADTTVVAAESTPAPADSVQIAAETPDIPADSTPAAADSVQAAAGTPADPAETSVAPADSTPAATAEEREVSADRPQADSSATALDTTPVPYDIDARHIYLRGEGYMLASGDAELHNDDFRALADSIEYRREAGKLFLRGTAPRVHGFGAEYVLSGDAVDLDMDGSQVTARGEAALAGSEIDLTAPEIRVLIQDGALDRIVATHERPAVPGLPGLPGDIHPSQGSVTIAAATGEAPADTPPGDAGEQATGTEPGEPPGAATPAGEEPASGEGDASPTQPGDSAAALPPARPRAVAEMFELEGDSIDVQAPGEVLDRVVAVGGARGESLARDSLNTESTPEIARSDWVSGDTIIAIFRPVGAPADTSAEAGVEPVAVETGDGYQLDRLVARGEAASLYRMNPSDDGEEEEEGEEEGEGDENAPESETEPAQPPSEGGAASEDVPGEPLPAEAEPAADVAPETEAAPAPETEAAPETDVAPETEADPEPESTGTNSAAQTATSAAEENPESRLALHYVRGDLITIFMQDGEVTSVTVEGDARGVQLEPVAPPPPDTTAAPPSTRR